MNSQGKLDESLMKKSQPSGSQPLRLYGLAKIHKDNVPLRQMLSMPGSPYHKIALQISKWLSVVEECKINSSTKEISDSIHDIQIPIDHVLTLLNYMLTFLCQKLLNIALIFCTQENTKSHL